MGFECRKMSTSKVHAGNGSSRRLSFSLDAYENPTFFFPLENQIRSCETCRGRPKLQKQVHKGSSTSSSLSSSSSSSSSSYRFVIKRARCSVARFYQRIRSSISRAQHSIPLHRSRSQPTTSTRVPSSVSMTPQSQYARFGDSHQSEAIEDCIKFLKNSSRKEDFLNSSSCQLQHLLHSHRCY